MRQNKPSHKHHTNRTPHRQTTHIQTSRIQKKKKSDIGKHLTDKHNLNISCLCSLHKKSENFTCVNMH